MKKILILGGASVHCKLVKAAKEMGCYVIVTDYLIDSPAKQIADESWMINIMNVDQIVEKCLNNKVNAVIAAWLDPSQRPYQQICQKLGLPCYGSAEQFYILTDKNIFKNYCSKCGVDTIPNYTLLDIENKKFEFPVFVKPNDSRGSRGQMVCKTYEELSIAIEKAKSESSNNEFVIERYMEGKQDFSITYFVIAGNPYLIRTCDRFLGKIEDKLNKQCIGCIAPSKFNKLYLENVDHKVRHFIKSLGIQYGPVFIQGFVDGETVRFYDPGLRFPGGEYELLLKELTGIDLMKSMIEYALTGKISKCIDGDLFELNGKHIIQLDFTCKSGKIAKFCGLEEIRNNSKVISSFARYKIGEIVPDSGDVRQRVFEISMIIDNGISIADSVKEIQAVFDVLDENGKSMLVSKLDTNLLKYGYHELRN